MQNVITGAPEENGEGLNSIIMSCSIIAKYETSESQCQAVVETFNEGIDLINI